MADRSATASWNGTLAEGGGTVSLTTSGVLRDAAISWRPTARTAGGRPVMQAQGAGALCEARNCPVGLFVEQDGAYRPVLLVMSREAPFLGADGPVEAPHVSVLAAVP